MGRLVVFVAFGAIALMHTFLMGAGIDVEPLSIAFWGIPTAVCVFFIHSFRLYRLDRYLAQHTSEPATAEAVAQ